MTGSIAALCSHYPDCSPLCSLVSDNQQPGLRSVSPVKVLLACNQPSTGSIEEHYTCYAQTNRSISSSRLILCTSIPNQRRHIEHWKTSERIIRESFGLRWQCRCSGSLVVTSDVLRVIVATAPTAPWSHTWHCPRPPQPPAHKAPVTQFKRNNFTTKH